MTDRPAAPSSPARRGLLPGWLQPRRSGAKTPAARRKRKRPAERIRWIALLGLVPALICAAVAQQEPFFARAVRDVVFDSYQRLSPRPYDPDIPVRVVAIDDESLNRIGQWPWPRAKIAELVDKLNEAGAAAIALDILFSEPERSADANGLLSGDEALRVAISKSRVALGTILLQQGGSEPDKPLGDVHTGDDPRYFLPSFTGALQPLDPLRQAAQELGALNIQPDRDLVVREIPTVFGAAGKLVPSLDVAALLVAQETGSVVIRSSNSSGTVGGSAFGATVGILDLKIGKVETSTGRDGSIRIHYAGPQPQRSIPAWQILSGGYEHALVENAVVLVGITATGFDIRATPLSPVAPGVEIRAEMVENLLTGSHLTRPDYMPGFEALMVIVGAVFAVAAASRLSPFAASVVTLTLIGLFIGCSAVSFLQLHELLNPVWPTLGSISALGVSTLVVLRQSEQERQQIRDAFSRYVSPNVVETLVRDPSRLVLGGENRILTVMFSDIRGFTSRSETMPAESVVRFLNQVHTPMTEHVLATDGTLDKFIGDGMMAFWNAPLDHPDHVRAALRCALRMEATVADINLKLADQSKVEGGEHEPLGIGIGIHTGLACIGNIGSLRRFDYSAIGDTVNTSARLEPMCKTYGVSIVVSSEIVEAAPDFAFLLLDIVRLKGKSQSTRLYALHGDETALTPAFRTFRDAHDEAVRLTLERSAEARAALLRCAESPFSTRCRVLYSLLERRVSASVPEYEL